MSDFVQTRSGLLVPLAEFAEDPAPAKPQMGEIASISNDINRLIFGGVLENLDDTLRTRGQGKGLKIYEELERDAHVYAVLAKRKTAVTSRPWRVDPATDSADDKRAADIVQRQLAALKFDRLTENLLDATLKGYAVAEVIWEVRGAELWAARVKRRNQRRFVFGEDEGLRLLTREQPMKGTELPERKFIVHSVGNDESRYGLGLGHKLFWLVWFKRQDIGFWMKLLDKYGMPTALGKYPSGAGIPEQRKLMDALAAIAQDTAVIIPEGMLVELVEAKRTGSADGYEKLARYLDEQIAECVLGETMSTTAQAAGLGSTQANVHNEVRLELAQADADALSDTLNDTLVQWIVDYNLPGAGYPTVWRDFDEPEDIEARSKVDKTLHDMGYEPESIEYINETYGGKWRKKAAAVPAGRPGLPAPDGTAPQFAEDAGAAALVDQATADQRALAQAAEDLSARWQALIGPRVDELIAYAEASGDLITLRERLAELAAAAPAEALQEALDRAGFAAQLAGTVAARAVPPGAA